MPNQISALESTGINIGEVYRLIKDQSADLAEIKGDVKTQIGAVANLTTRVAVLEDRQGQARDNHARYAGWLSGLVGLGSWIYQLWAHKP